MSQVIKQGANPAIPMGMKPPQQAIPSQPAPSLPINSFKPPTATMRGSTPAIVMPHRPPTPKISVTAPPQTQVTVYQAYGKNIVGLDGLMNEIIQNHITHNPDGSATITLPNGKTITFSSSASARQWLQNSIAGRNASYYQYQGQSYGDQNSLINAILSQGKPTQNGFTITLPDGTTMIFTNQQIAQQWLQNNLAGKQTPYYQYQGQSYGDLNSLIIGILSQGKSTQNGFTITLPNGEQITFLSQQEAQQWLQNSIMGKTPTSSPKITPISTPRLISTSAPRLTQTTINKINKPSKLKSVTITPQLIQLKLPSPTQIQAESQYVVTEPVVVDDPFMPPASNGKRPQILVGWKTTIYSASEWAKLAPQYKNMQITTENAGTVKPIIQPVAGTIPQNIMTQINQQNAAVAQFQQLYQNIGKNYSIKQTPSGYAVTLPNGNTFTFQTLNDAQTFMRGGALGEIPIQTSPDGLITINDPQWERILDQTIRWEGNLNQYTVTLPTGQKVLAGETYKDAWWWVHEFTSGDYYHSPIQDKNGNLYGSWLSYVNAPGHISPGPFGSLFLELPNGSRMRFATMNDLEAWARIATMKSSPPLTNYLGALYATTDTLASAIVKNGKWTPNGFQATLPGGEKVYINDTVDLFGTVKALLQNQATVYQAYGKNIVGRDGLIVEIIQNHMTYNPDGSVTVTLPNGGTMTFSSPTSAQQWLINYFSGNLTAYQYRGQDYGDQSSFVNAILSQGQSSQNGFTITLPDGTKMTFANQQQAQQWLQNYAAGQKASYYQYQGQSYGDQSSFVNAILSQGQSTQNGFVVTLPDGTKMTFVNKIDALNWLQNYVTGKQASYYQYGGQSYGDLYTFGQAILSQGKSTQNGFTITLPDGTPMTFSDKTSAWQWLQNYLLGKTQQGGPPAKTYGLATVENVHEFGNTTTPTSATPVYQYNGQYYGDQKSYLQALQNSIQPVSTIPPAKPSGKVTVESGSDQTATMYLLKLDNNTTIYFSDKQSATQFIQNLATGNAQLYQYNGKYYGDLPSYQNAVRAATETQLVNSIKPVQSTQFSHAEIEAGAAPTGAKYQVQTDAGIIYFSDRQAAVQFVQDLTAGKTPQVYNINGVLYGDPNVAQTAYQNSVLASGQISKVTAPVVNYSGKNIDLLASAIQTNKELMGSYKVTVGGQTIGYFASQSDAQKALNDYLQYLAGGHAPKWYTIPNAGNLISLSFPTSQSFVDYLTKQVQKIGSDYYLNLSSYTNPNNPLGSTIQTQTYKFTSPDQAQKFINLIVNGPPIKNIGTHQLIPANYQNIAEIYTTPDGYTFVGRGAATAHMQALAQQGLLPVTLNIGGKQIQFNSAQDAANYLNGKYLIVDSNHNIVAVFDKPPTQDQLAQYGIYTNATPQGTGMLFVQTLENVGSEISKLLPQNSVLSLFSFLTTGNPTPPQTPQTQPQITYQLVNPNQVTWQVQNGTLVPQEVPQKPAPIGANYLPWMGFAGTLLTGLYRTPEMFFAASNLLANTATNLKFQAQQAGQSLYTTGVNRMGEAFILNSEGILAAIGGSALAFLGGLTSIVNPNALASAKLPTPYWVSAGAGVVASLFVGGSVADFLQTFKLGKATEAVGEVATTTKIAESGIPILKQGETVGQILGKDILVGGKAVLPTTEGVTTILKPTLFTRIGAALRSLEDIRIGGVTARSLTDLSVGGGLMVGLNSVLTGHLPTSVGEALSEFETGALYSVGFIPVGRVLGRLGAIGSRLAAGPTYGMINVGLGIMQGENNPQSLARSFLLGFGLAYAGDIATGLARGVGKVATKISDVYHSIPRAPEIMQNKSAILEAKISEVLGQQGIKPLDTEARGSFPIEQLNFLENIMPEEKVQGQEPFVMKPTWFTRVTLIPAYGRWFANELVDAFRNNVLSKFDVFRPRAIEYPDLKEINTTPHPLNYLEAYQDLLSRAGNRYPRMLLDKFAEWREVPEELRIFTPSELDMWRNYEFISNFDRIPKAFSDLADRFSRFGERFSKGTVESLNEAYRAQWWLSRDLREPIPEDVMKQLIRQNRPLTWREQMNAVLDSLPKLELPEEISSRDLATQVKDLAARARANKALGFLSQLETPSEELVKTFTESIRKEEKPEFLQPKEKPAKEGKEIQSGSSALIVLPKEEEVKSTGLTSEQVKDIVDTMRILKEKGYAIEDIMRGLLAKGYTPEQLEQLLFKAMMKLPNLTDQEYARLSSFLVGQKRVTTEELKPPEYKSPYPKLYQRGRYITEYQFLRVPPSSPWATQEARRPTLISTEIPQREFRLPALPLPEPPSSSFLQAFNTIPTEATQTRPNLALGLGLGLGSLTSQIQRPRFILNILEELTPIVSSVPAPAEVATTITSQVTTPWRIPVQTPWSDIFLTPLLSPQTTPTQTPIMTPIITPTTVPTETPTETPTVIPLLSPQNIEIIIPRDKLKQPGPPPPPQQSFGVIYTPRHGARSPLGYNYGLLVHRISENIVADFGAVVQNLVRGIANSNVIRNSNAIRMSRGFHDPGVIFMSRGFRSSAPILMSKGFHDPAIIRMSRGFASRLPISMRRTFVNPFSFAMVRRSFRSTFPINARTQFSVKSLSFFNPNQKRKLQIAQPLTNPLTNITSTNVFAKNYRAITQGIIGSVNA